MALAKSFGSRFGLVGKDAERFRRAPGLALGRLYASRESVEQRRCFGGPFSSGRCFGGEGPEGLPYLSYLRRRLLRIPAGANACIQLAHRIKGAFHRLGARVNRRECNAQLVDLPFQNRG